ncbi:MAG: SusD/RagB family nutrient-binding outer membrane lipoprotein, partial [Paludibacteraceae bacterium]|nr:SusD/RagB family nutrient-binding outer membrane lipoprotein [Paludibacteraceae bacterium]
MKKLFIISALLGAMFFTSCEDFLDVNYTKDSPITTSVDQVLPVATFYASQICYDHAEYGVYMCQALTTTGKSQTGSYPYSQGWEFLGVNRHPMWRRHFYDLGANIQKMNEIAMENGQYNAVLIGRTVMLMSTMFTTDAFGDMPRSEVYQSASPKYDTQEEVYAWMMQEADDLIKLYNDPAWVDAKTNLLINERMDRIYAGDMDKWEVFCKALRARLWLRKLPNWDNTPANCQKIIAMVDEVLNDANWQEPRYYYPGGVTESNCPWGPFKPIINSWESRANRLD